MINRKIPLLLVKEIYLRNLSSNSSILFIKITFENIKKY